MFTGIVEEIGKIQKITNNSITVDCRTVVADVKIGDSIAVNGVCLTVREYTNSSFTADISPETFRVTAPFKQNGFVNLERAMRADGRFGGHIVSGHIDGVGEFIDSKPQNDFYEILIKVSEDISKYAVKKGSISINGISLTIADVENNIIKMAIIPHTFKNTNLQYLRKGDFVNIEADILAKYVEKFLSPNDNKSRLDLNFLQENGFV